MNYANNTVSHHLSHLLANAGNSAPAHHNKLLEQTLDLHAPVLTQFGDLVDVRKRGALRIMRTAGAPRNLETPAVVRLWHEEQCRELSAHQARALANQLLAAADLVDSQNRRD